MERILEYMLLSAILVFLLPSMVLYLTHYVEKLNKILVPEVYSEYASLIETQLIGRVGGLSYTSIADFMHEYYSKPEKVAYLVGLPVKGELKYPSIRFIAVLRPLITPVLHREATIYIIRIPDLGDSSSFAEGFYKYLMKLSLPNYVVVKAIEITSFSDWRSIVENPPKNIIVVNPYDALPVPSGYDALTFIDKIKENCENSGWIYVNTKGKPFAKAYIEGSGYIELGVSGLNKFLSDFGITASFSSAPVAVQLTIYGKRACCLVEEASIPASVDVWGIAFSPSDGGRIYVNYADVSGSYYTMFLFSCKESSSNFGFLLNADSNLQEEERGSLVAALTIYTGIWYTADVYIYGYGGKAEVVYTYTVKVWFYRSGSLVYNVTVMNYEPLTSTIREYNPDAVAMVATTFGLHIIGYYFSYIEPSEFVADPSLRNAPRLLPSPREFASGKTLNAHTISGVFTVDSDKVVSGDIDTIFGFAGTLILVDPTSYDYCPIPFLLISYPPQEVNIYGKLEASQLGFTVWARHYKIISVRGTPFLLEVVCGK